MVQALKMALGFFRRFLFHRLGVSRQKKSFIAKVSDITNGFGARSQLQSSLRSGVKFPGLCVASCLDGVQVVTRYCAQERPYWHGFLLHYCKLGVCIFHVCVQSKDDEDELRDFVLPDGCQLFIYVLSGSVDPSAVLKLLPWHQICHQAPYTLMVDGDEFFLPLRPDLSVHQLFHLFPATAQWFFPWLMRPCVEQVSSLAPAYWGHVGKPLIRSDRIQGVVNDHRFGVKSSDQPCEVQSSPAGLFGFSIVHFCARSFRDALLRTLMHRFQDIKSQDHSAVLAQLKRGFLPIRLRLLAFLMVQKGFVQLPQSLQVLVDSDVEAQMLRRFLTASEEARVRENFDAYCRQLQDSMGLLPVYPAMSLMDLAPLLPDPQSSLL